MQTQVKCLYAVLSGRKERLRAMLSKDLKVVFQDTTLKKKSKMKGLSIKNLLKHTIFPLQAKNRQEVWNVKKNNPWGKFLPLITSTHICLVSRLPGWVADPYTFPFLWKDVFSWDVFPKRWEQRAVLRGGGGTLQGPGGSCRAAGWVRVVEQDHCSNFETEASRK